MSGKKKSHNNGKTPSLADADLSAAVDTVEEYERRISKLQFKLLALQQRYLHEGRRAIIAFEGWDAAGKGGVIRRLNERLEPRHCHVWSIAAPNPDDQGRHYLYRFWVKLPLKGDLAIFDRTWYGRVLVERVEGFARKQEWRRAYEEINEFERMLVDDGARIVKLFLHISPEEQLARFTERLKKPHKRWKLTPEDIRNRDKRAAYEEAIAEMFEKTHTEAAPWHVISAEHKLHGRIQAMETVLDVLGKDVETSPPPADPEVVELFRKRYGIEP
ncbi:MAG: polyphosphate kinase 2 family protein [Rhodospirillaceae bacterium]